MAKNKDAILKFVRAKEDTIENLEAIKSSLNQCIDEGMIDEDDAYYNELLGLIDDARIVDTWEDLAEIITKAKTLEVDVAAWLSFHGRTSISLPWPKAVP